ncbi:site-specific integrase [Bacillus sp. FSL W7-1360]
MCLRWNEILFDRDHYCSRSFSFSKSRSLSDALEEGIITKNPTYKAQVVGKIAPKDENLKYLSYGEAQMLIDELKHNLKPSYISRYVLLFALATGARFSEIMGLTWECVKWDPLNDSMATVKIEKTWDYKHTKDFDNTKNYFSKRTITLDKHTGILLMDLWKHQQKLMKTKRVQNYRNLVFINSEMRLISNEAVNKTLKKFCTKIGVHPVTCHALRHTHASLLLYKQCNIKYVSRRLGHTDVITTLRVYAHIIDEMEQRDSQEVNNLMDGLHKTHA